MNGDDAASIARIEQKIDSFIGHAKEQYVSRADFLVAISKIDSFIGHAKQQYVSKADFLVAIEKLSGRLKPIERFFWPIVSLTIAGIVAAVLALVITT